MKKKSRSWSQRRSQTLRAHYPLCWQAQPRWVAECSLRLHGLRADGAGIFTPFADCFIAIETVQGQEDELLSLVNDAVPQDHPHYAAIKSRVQVLLGNPGWPQERKLVFARRLIKHLA